MMSQHGNYNYKWRTDAPTMSKLKNYLTAISDESLCRYIPVENRLAVFDVDGTLVSETDPHYIVALLWLHAVLEDSSWTPSARNIQLAKSFKASLVDGTPFECDDYDTLLKVQEERFLGMTPGEYEEYVTRWLSTQPSRFFEPMTELINLLRGYQFTIFLISASDRDFMRCLTSKPLSIPPYHIIGSDISYILCPEKDNFIPTLHKMAKDEKIVHDTFETECDGLNKVMAIAREIGKQPVLAFGNSSGDFSMFRYTSTNNPYPAEVFCLLNDDPAKVNGDSHRVKKYKDVCTAEGWNTISMADEWLIGGR